MTADVHTIGADPRVQKALARMANIIPDLWDAAGADYDLIQVVADVAIAQQRADLTADRARRRCRMTSPDHDAVRADIPDAVVLAVLEELGWPDDRNAIQEDVNVQPGCHWDLAADVARAATAALTADLTDARARVAELEAELDQAIEAAAREAAYTAGEMSTGRIRHLEAEIAVRTSQHAAIGDRLRAANRDRDALRNELARARGDRAQTAAEAINGTEQEDK